MRSDDDTLRLLLLRKHSTYLITTQKNFQLLFDFGRSLCVLCHVRSVQLNNKKKTSKRQLASSVSENAINEGSLGFLSQHIRPPPGGGGTPRKIG